ncbi:Pre-mRNA 3'-end-processing endonuclease polyadenylation factor C-term [Penicillium cf. griseofulvum]|uniref:Endoribonuclease YSH1 n=1 Tax=Penicillium cf. griseofulvum TaxID=2972120 RepID=A0A9W9J214_9EURO|nr:Pre-mRNA 3'-end-processing endonuclease polyadenylation factor C-term [Penicillium cf. griseofulvum]KAJ5422852.1 Pre-mRNA 3'-end-processing endonuclease polyadenylation factor C-term [Penicillium cf. griseofulvum]KAJ5433931.1 Pre-mRNA 3'-end-processing endonuclease polyadenylation factor C-term [Penicillium cf. griseofulvum]
MASKRKASSMGTAVDDEPVDPSDELAFYCLGGGNEVGRSCHILEYKGKTVMLDAGMHPAKEGFSALPFFDEFDLSTVDVLLISHFHVDHSSALPYVLSKTNFKGRVFMTPATRAIYKWLIQDNVRVSNTSSSSDQRTTLYTERDHLSTLPMIETIDFYTTHTINGIRITPYPAGHVLGAAMFKVDIAGLVTLFTGDYSREEDRHLIPAAVPKGTKIDVLITESTFGISSNPPRLEREAALMKSITSILNRGGRVLMPVFALGRAQELLLILDEYWETHPELQKFPIYYIGNMARRCMVVYQTYIGAMNDNIKRLFRQRMAEAEASGNKSVSVGPWDFRFVRSLRSLERFDDVGGCVMLASPGMLQTGTSRELLERWAPSDRNGVVITGYSVEGTMAKGLLNEPDQIPAVMSKVSTGHGRGRVPGVNDEDQKVMIPRRCTIDEVSFAAHVDGVENRTFIEEVGAPVVILVHGEKHQMMRLKSKLLSLNADKAVKVKVYTPANCDEVRIPFKKDKIAKVVGKLAELAPPSENDDSQLMAGVLVQNGFNLSLMAPDDLQEYAGLTTTTITCKQHITLSSASMDLIRWALEGTFGAIEEVGNSKKTKVNGKNGMDTDNIQRQEDADEEIPSDETQTFLVMGCVYLRHHSRTREVELEWEGNMMNDGVADAVMAVLLTVESSPASVKQSAKNKHHHHHHDDDDMEVPSLPNNPHAQSGPQERLARMLMMLEAQFGGDNIGPIERPRVPADLALGPQEDGEEMNEERIADIEAAELDRLITMGIPVPGIEIRVDKHIARVWLEDLEVECANPVLRDRIRVVVERAIETVAGLWAESSIHQDNGPKGIELADRKKAAAIEAHA